MRVDEHRSDAIPRDLQELVGSLDRRGKRIAVIAFHRQDTEQISYIALASKARRFAGHLVEQMAQENRYMIILAPPSVDYMAAALGAFLMGIGVAPLDTQMPDDVLRHVIEDSGSKHVVTTAHHAERLKTLFPDKSLKFFLLDAKPDAADYWLPESVKERAAPDRKVDEDTMAALFYTSGTTGMPKGVPLTHTNLAFQIKAIQDHAVVTEGARALLPLPLHHVYPFVIGVLAPLALGITIVLPSALTGPQLLRALREAKATHLIAVPRLYEALLSGLRARMKERGKLVFAGFTATFAISRLLRRRLGLHAGKLLFSPLHKRVGPGLRVMASGGAPLPEALAWALETLGWEIAIGYGLTETSPLLTLNPPGKARIGSVGRVIDGIELRIAQVADVHEPQGEVQVRGPCVFRGYHNLAEKTQEAFTEDGWFRTGDIGWLDNEGYLFLSGRLSTLIVTPGGENVQPNPLEKLYSEHPAIREIGILQHNESLVGVVVPETDVITSEDKRGIEKAIREAIQNLRRNLASYQQLTDFVISGEDLARTRMGKIKRQELKERFEGLAEAAGRDEAEKAVPISMDEMSDRDRALLESDASRRVWDWFAETHPHTRLSPDTDLRLELDIDSLAWLEITQRVREIAGVELDEQAIARTQTLRNLLTAVADSSREIDRTAETPELFDAPEAALTERQQHWLEPLSGIATAAAWLTYRVNRVLMRVSFRLQVTGLDNLPDESPFIIAPNHTSYLDPFALAAALGFAQLRKTHWGGWTGAVLITPWRRFFARLAQVMPIEPEKPASSIAAGAAVLRRKRSLIWFPEGMRSPDGKLQTFKPGIGLLLQHLDVPVVPVYIDGTYEALPVGARFIRLKHINITIGKPLRADTLIRQGQGSKDYERIADALHGAVKNLS